MPFLLVSSSDHLTGVTGLTPTVTISKDGGSFASPSGAVSEIGNGWYALAGNAADRNTLGALVLHATGTGADPTDTLYTITGYDPFEGVRLGLTAFPNAATGTAGAVITQGTGTAQLNVASGVAASNTTQVNGVAVASNDGTAQAGASSTITLASSDSGGTNAYVDRVITIVGGTGYGQSRVITAYNSSTKVATVQRAWDTTPDSTSLYAIDPSSVAASVVSAVSLNTTQTGWTFRDVTSVADGSLTLSDLLAGGMAAGTGKLVAAASSTSVVAKTPSTGTLLRTFTLDAAPTSAPYARN